MLKSKVLLTLLQEELAIIGSKSKEYKKMQEFLKEQYDLALVDYAQYVIGARDMEEIEPKLAYWLIKGINKIHEDVIDEKKYFSDAEIREYDCEKHVWVEEEKYPYVIDGVSEVADDQWSVVLDLDAMKELYNKQLLIYNPNTQRELKKKVRNGEVYYVINVNESSVNEIKRALLDGEFIPNTLSFNLNMDNPEVNFDIQGNRIILNSGQFDIIDGFHRFKAAMKAKIANPELRFKFIVSIMNFNEAKACSFIAQENKRNKISSNYSKALESNNPTKIIVDRINTSPNSLIKGLIGKEGISVINLTDIFGLIDNIYDTKKMNRSELLKTSNHIINVINMCVDENPDLMENITLTELGIIIYGSTLATDEVECFETISRVMPNKYSIGSKITAPNRKNINLIERLFD